MVTEFGGCILAAGFGFVPDCTLDATTCKLDKLSYIHVTATRRGECPRSMAGQNGLPYLQSLLVASGVGWAWSCLPGVSRLHPLACGSYPRLVALALCSAWMRGISWIPQCSWAGVHTLWYIPPPPPPRHPCPPLRVWILYTAPCLWLVSQARGLYSLWSCQATALPSHLLMGDSWTSQVWQCLSHHASPRLLGRAFNI